MDTLVFQDGVHYKQIMTSTEVQQQSITWFQIREATPPDHTLSGNTVITHVSISMWGKPQHAVIPPQLDASHHGQLQSGTRSSSSQG